MLARFESSFVVLRAVDCDVVTGTGNLGSQVEVVKLLTEMGDRGKK